MKFLKSYFLREESAAGLAVFRITYGMVVLLEVLQLYRFRHLVFDAEPFIVTNDITIDYALKAWMICLVLLILGFQTKAMTVVNYVMSILTFGTFHVFEYHADYAYLGLNLVMIFTPVSAVCSLDHFFSHKSEEKPEKEKVYRFHYELIIFLGVGLVYFDSIFYKLQSPMWTDGLGLWHPATLPQDTFTPMIRYILDFKWLVLFLGYLTIFFETIFVFLMWFPKMRIPLFIVGIGLHIGIALVFPIPYFGFVCTCVYLLLLPPEFWGRVIDRISTWITGRKLYAKLKFDRIFSRIQNSFQVSPLQLNKKFNLIVCIIFFVSSILIQGNLIVRRSPNLIDSPTWRKIVSQSRKWNAKIWPYPRVLAGLTDHGVFYHTHYLNYNHVFAIVYKRPGRDDVWLPILDKDGVAGEYLRGRFWVYWTFRVCAPTLKMDQVLDGMEKITSIWASETNRLILHNAKFDILYREVDPVNGWEKGFYQRQMEKEWKKCGEIIWKEGVCTVTVDDLEKQYQEKMNKPESEDQ